MLSRAMLLLSFQLASPSVEYVCHVGLLIVLCLCIGLFFGAVGFVIFEGMSKGKFIRYPLALAAILWAIAASTTDPWPDGVGMERCLEVVNPALSIDSAAEDLIETCGDLDATSAPVLLLLAFALAMVAPELSEFSVLGLFSLKKEIIEQKGAVAEQGAQIADLRHQIATSSSSSSASTHVNITNTVEQTDRDVSALRVEDEAAFSTASRLERALLDDLADSLLGLSPPNSEISTSIYLYSAADEVLHQLGSADEVTDFAIGKGATGQAYQAADTIVVTAEAVHNSEYGLTPEQQARFADKNIVGATPITINPPGSPVSVVGVVSAVGTVEMPADGEQRERLRLMWAGALEISAPLVGVYLQVFGILRE